VDLSPLLELCDQADGTVFKIIDLIDPSSPPKFFIPAEFLRDKHYVSLAPYRSLLWGVFVETLSPSTERALFEQSFRRLQLKLAKGMDASSNLVYRELVGSFDSHSKFGAALSRLERVLRPDSRSTFPEDMRQLLYMLSRGPNSPETKLLGYLHHLASGAVGTDAALQELTASILRANEIGPIVFITPEMGRFSTVGGIGVMVSELTRSLADLGLDVRVISPYYNYDKKGNTGYLEAEGIKWKQNIITSAGNENVECGLHTGEEFGVKLYFIHHWKYFSTPYQSGPPMDQLQALVVMAKSSLELLCQLQVIPSIVVTNDWFTGLVPAYARETGKSVVVVVGFFTYTVFVRIIWKFICGNNFFPFDS
jgi:starch synthase